MTCWLRAIAGTVAAVGRDRLYHMVCITENDVLSNGIAISYPFLA